MGRVPPAPQAPPGPPRSWPSGHVVGPPCAPGPGGAVDVSPLPLSKLQGGIHFSLLNSLSRRSQSAGIRSALWPHESPLGFLWVMHCVPAVLPWDPRRLRGLFARPGGWDAHTQRSQASEGTRAIDTRPPARPHLTDVRGPAAPDAQHLSRTNHCGPSPAEAPGLSSMPTTRCPHPLDLSRSRDPRNQGL